MNTDTIYLKKAYECFLKENLPNKKSILIPRRDTEERNRQRAIVANRWLKKYISDGCNGDLTFSDGLEVITELPDDIKTIHGNVTIPQASELTKLPSKLKLVGSLYINNSRYIERLPPMLEYIQGTLSINGGLITELPDNLKAVTYGLELHNSKIKKLPPNLAVGDLSITGTTALQEIPETMVIKGNIYLSRYIITGGVVHVPEKFHNSVRIDDEYI